MKIITLAKKIGFDLAAITSAKPSLQSVKAFNQWISQKYEGQMSYMSESARSVCRRDPQKILPEAKSVITLALNYYYEQGPLPKGHGKVARYAYGRDYHKIIAKMLRAFTVELQKLLPDAKFKSFVDTGPILERDFAQSSGLGVIGKNACLITSDYGSWVFLAEVITTAKLISTNRKNLPRPLHLYPDARPPEPLKPTEKPFSACGACTRCIDACPTKAIIAPGVIDARRCISYLTIELKEDEIQPELAKIIKETKLLYGCDICQEVCPHNQKRQKTHQNHALKTAIAGSSLSLKKINSLSSREDLLQNFAGSPIMRAGLKGLQRNARANT